MALLLSGLLLVACGDTSDEPKSSANEPTLDTIELGTAVKDVIAPTRTPNDADNAFNKDPKDPNKYEQEGQKG